MDTKKMMLLALIGGLLFSLTACSKPVNVPLSDVLDEIKEAFGPTSLPGATSAKRTWPMVCPDSWKAIFWTRIWVFS